MSLYTDTHTQRLIGTTICVIIIQLKTYVYKNTDPACDFILSVHAIALIVLFCSFVFYIVACFCFTVVSVAFIRSLSYYQIKVRSEFLSSTKKEFVE